MSFPVIKLTSQFIKQLSKPLANYVKRRAKEYYFVRTFICMPPAQFYHRMDVRLRMRLAGTCPSKSKIKALTDENAINMGSELLGEIIIFSVAAGVLWMEYARQTGKAVAHEESQDLSLVRLSRDVQRLTERTMKQGHQLKEIARLLEVAGNTKLDNRENLNKLVPTTKPS